MHLSPPTLSSAGGSQEPPFAGIPEYTKAKTSRPQFGLISRDELLGRFLYALFPL